MGAKPPQNIARQDKDDISRRFFLFLMGGGGGATVKEPRHPESSFFFFLFLCLQAVLRYDLYRTARSGATIPRVVHAPFFSTD